MRKTKLGGLGYAGIRRIKLGSLTKYTLLFMLLALVVYPFVYAFVCSFKTAPEILTGTHFLPKELQIENYSKAWVTANFSKYTFNSAWYSVISVISALFTSAAGGYVFERGEFRGKKIIFAAFTSLMFVTLGTANMYPQLEILQKLHLNKSLWGIIVMHFFGVNITNIYLVRSYLSNIPRELDEAAEIDGCNFIKTFLIIILPVLKPVMATVGIFAFGTAWNDYLWPMVVTLSNPAQRTLAVGMISLKGDANAAAAWNLILAGAMISAAPMTVVYLIFNKYFIRGVAAGAVKG